MHPKDFEEYWDMTHAELAQLLGEYTVYGVQNWFRKTDPAPIPENVFRQLNDIHLRWEYQEKQDERITPIDRELYLICKERRRRKRQTK